MEIINHQEARQRVQQSIRIMHEARRREAAALRTHQTASAALDKAVEQHRKTIGYYGAWAAKHIHIARLDTTKGSTSGGLLEVRGNLFNTPKTNNWFHIEYVPFRADEWPRIKQDVKTRYQRTHAKVTLGKKEDHT